MSISFNLSAAHQVIAANNHYYEKPTEPLYLNRTLQYHDFIYLCEGKWTITENETDYHLQKDDVLLLSAGHHHYTRLPCAPGTRTMCIHISCEEGDLAASNALTLPAQLHVRGYAQVRHLFEKIVSTYWSEQTHKQERLCTLVHQLLLELLDVTESACPPDNLMAQEIIQLVHAAPHKRFTTQEMADRFHVSTKTIDSSMIRATGLSFSKYQTNLKLEMVAAQLRVEPDVKLSEIAATFAFYDEFHLSRAFKQKYGVSPTKYKHTHSP
ncbi:MAG: helix-turn-helix transcriptional regulator [Clostridia bacterium]|nr:helix-turn-helix transcriptional regulator [Clostridia bacterium]